MSCRIAHVSKSFCPYNFTCIDQCEPPSFDHILSRPARKRVALPWSESELFRVNTLECMKTVVSQNLPARCLPASAPAGTSLWLDRYPLAPPPAFVVLGRPPACPLQVPRVFVSSQRSLARRTVTVAPPPRVTAWGDQPALSNPNLVPVTSAWLFSSDHVCLNSA